MKPLHLLIAGHTGWLLPVLCAALYLPDLTAQVHIGANTPPKPSAMLEITAADKGVLFPTVALQSLYDSVIIKGSKPVDGLMVFNTTDNAAIYRGLYAWNSVKRVWENILSENSMHSMLTSHYATEDVYFVANVVSTHSLDNKTVGRLTFKEGIAVNKENCFDTTKSEFTVPAAGYYKIMAGMEVHNDASMDKDNKAAIRLIFARAKGKKDSISATTARSFLQKDGQSSETVYLPQTPSVMHSGYFDKGDRIFVNGYIEWKNSVPGYISRKYLYINTL